MTATKDIKETIAGPIPNGVTKSPNSPKYPVAAYYILAGYLLERTVYYSLFGGVVFYLQRVLRFSAASATTLKAVTEGLIFIAPVAGAVLADAYLGKIRTVLFMSCLFTIGSLVFTLSSVRPLMTAGSTQALGIIGVLILGLSAGFMKAIYTSLGPCQFKMPEQRKQQQRYFNAFYWMINAGGLIGTILTAQLRSSVQCFGYDCYMLPFLISCGLIALSTFIFFSGRKKYIDNPPDPTLINSIKCIAFSFKKSITDRNDRVHHWIDRSKHKFSPKLIEDVKNTLSVLQLFVSFPIFFALFHQAAIGMIFQSKRFNNRIGWYQIPPEITSSVNSFLIIILIPLFDLCIYPFFDRRGILRSTTTRMRLGLVLEGVAFLLYGIANRSVEQNILGARQAQLSLYNTRDCFATISAEWLPHAVAALPGLELQLEPIFLTEEEAFHRANFSCGSFSQEIDIKLKERHETTVAILSHKLLVLPPTKDYLKDKDAEAKLRIIAENTPSLEKQQKDVTLRFKDLTQSFSLEGEVSGYQTINPHTYTIYQGNSSLGEADIRQDGVYVLVATEGRGLLFNMTKPSNTHIFWLLPQYLFMTIGEVFFSVSTMDFAYTEAPTSMKSVMQSARLFTIAIGLWTIASFSEVSTRTGIFDYRASNEAFTYAAAMGVNAAVFAVLVRFYNRRKKRREELRQCQGKENQGFREEKI